MEASGADLSAFEREKNKIRKILIGSCKLNDPKMEKNGAYEFTPAVSAPMLFTLCRKTTSSLNVIA